MIDPRAGLPRRLLLLALLALFVFSALAWRSTAAGQAGVLPSPSPVVYLPLVANGVAPIAHPTRTPTAMATSMATATMTNTPTTTATPTATATATPTVTATPSDSRYCKDVYPIWIGAQLLDLNAGKFLPPSDPVELPFYVPYSDDTYTDKWQRRVYVPTSSTLGYGFISWLSSVSSDSAFVLAEALTGTGTLDKGFEEVVPWPDPNQPMPIGYPLLPGRPNEGDWINGFVGIANNAEVKASLDRHVQQRTAMILPIISERVGSGQNTYVHMLKFGTFLLRGYALSGRSYLDLVYLGKSSVPSGCITEYEAPNGYAPDR
jgi:hypothetical protein